MLIEVATKHFGTEWCTLFEKLADMTMEVRNDHEKRRLRPPSTAEFLDAILAYQQLREEEDGGIAANLLNDIANLTLRKTSDKTTMRLDHQTA